jgi:hypothetical protein
MKHFDCERQSRAFVHAGWGTCVTCTAAPTNTARRPNSAGDWPVLTPRDDDKTFWPRLAEDGGRLAEAVAQRLRV